MQHPTIEDIRDWLDGNLAGEDERAIASHVEHCSACSRSADEHRSLDLLLGSIGTPEPIGFARKVRMEAEQRTGHYSRVPRWVPFVAAAALLMVIFFSMSPVTDQSDVMAFSDDEIEMVAQLDLLEDMDLAMLVEDVDADVVRTLDEMFLEEVR